MDEKDERIKMDDFFIKMNKRMNNTCSQPKLCVNPNTTSSQLRGIYQPKHHLFISKMYVPIKN